MPATIFKGNQPPVGVQQDDLFIRQSDGSIFYFNGLLWVPISAAPTGAAGGDLTGTYPNPTIKSGVSLASPTMTSPTMTSPTSTGTFLIGASSGVVVAGQALTVHTATNRNLAVVDSTSGPVIQAQNDANNASIPIFIGNSSTVEVTAGGGIQIGAPTGGDKGAGTLNAGGLYDNGNRVPPPQPITNSLGSDVSLSNTGSYFDGPSVAQGSTGTWFASGTVTCFDTAVAANFEAKLWDGTTIIATTEHKSTGANEAVALALSGYLASPAGNLRISVKDITATTGKIASNATGSSLDSTITAIRVG